MNFLYKRILYFIGFGSFTLTGCFSAKYGMPTDYESYKAIKVITEKNKPIEGLVEPPLVYACQLAGKPCRRLSYVT